MLNKIRRFTRLEPKDRRRLVLATFMLPLVRLSTRLGGYERTRRATDVLFPLRAGQDHVDAVEHGGRIRRLVEAAARHGGSDATCLPQALVTWTLLRREGIASEICLGVRMIDGSLQGHAWVEVDGQSLDDSTAIIGPPYESFHSA